MSDFRYAVRRLLRSPGFTLAALATMALGIGANSAIFTVVNTVMLKPPAVERPDRLVEIYTSEVTGIPVTSSYPDYLEVRELPVFAGAAAHELTLLNRTEQGRSTVIFGESVAGNYFSLLGIRPSLGRRFEPADDRPGAPPTVVLGHAYWRRQFGADPAVLGRTMTLNGRAATIIGVAPASYRGGLVGFVVDLWIPLNTSYDLDPENRDRERRSNRSLFTKARLADGVSLSEAQAAVTVLATQLAQSYPDSNRNRTMTLYAASDVRLHPNVDRAIAPVAALLMAVPGLVLLVACANVANLLLARASGRTREIAVRLAVGASRRRLVRLLLAESLTLAIAGGVLGLSLAWALLRLVQGWTPPGLPIPVALDLAMDYRVVAFTLMVSIATGVAFGLAPALQATRPNLVPSLKDEGGAIRSYRRFGLRNALVVAQVSVSLVLLTAAGLFVRSLQRAQDIDPGFERQRAIILTPATFLAGRNADERRTLTETLRQRLAAIPGIESVALADRVPLGAQVRTTAIVVDDQQPDADGRGTEVDYTINDVGYFSVLSIPIVRGRDFTAQDDKSAPNVAIVSQAFAARFWPGTDPVGRRIRFATGLGRDPKGDESAKPIGPMTVIGVARDTKVRTLGEDPRPYFYRPWRQTDESMAFVLKTAGDPAALIETVRRTVVSVDADLPILSLNTMAQHLSLMLTPPRLAAGMLGIFGVFAVLLASMGLYAVVAFSVARRTKEVGIRMALGATRSQVIALVVREGMALIAVGIVFGLLLAAAIAQPLGAYLYGLDRFDPVTFTLVAIVMAATALVANYLPARRAVRIDPVIAIRYE